MQKNTYNSNRTEPVNVKNSNRTRTLWSGFLSGSANSLTRKHIYIFLICEVIWLHDVVNVGHDCLSDSIIPNARGQVARVFYFNVRVSSSHDDSCVTGDNNIDEIDTYLHSPHVTCVCPQMLKNSGNSINNSCLKPGTHWRQSRLLPKQATNRQQSRLLP